MQTKERRRLPRTSFCAAATLANGDDAIAGTLIDLSLAGVLFEAPDASSCLEVGDLVTVRTAGVAQEIAMPGRIVHRRAQHFGVAFPHLDFATRQSINALLDAALRHSATR